MHSPISRCVLSFLASAAFLLAQDSTPVADKVELADVIAMTRTRPVTFPATSISTADFLTQREKWALRRFLAAAKEELGSAASDPETAQILEDLIAWWGRSGHDFSAAGRGLFDGMWWSWKAESAQQGMKPLAKKARALLPPDAAKPLLQFFIASIVHATREPSYGNPADDYTESLTRLRRAIASAEQDSADPLILTLAVFQSFSLNPPSPAADAELATLFKVLPAALAEKSAPVADVPFVVDSMISRAGSRSVARRTPRLADAFLKSELPEWARLTLAGYCYLEPVSPFHWSDPRAEKGYRAAADCFERAWIANPQRPEAAAGMVRVAMGGFGKGKEDSRTWFDRATAVQCDFAEAYEQMLISLRSPGAKSYSVLLAFGLSCAKAGRTDTDVPEYLLIALGSIARDLPDWRLICRHPEIAAAVNDVLSRKAALAPDKELKQFYQGMAIVWGYMSGNFRLAAENLIALRPPDKKAFWWPRPANHFLVNCEIDSNRMMDESLARGDGSTGEVEAAYRAWEGGNFEQSAKLAAAELEKTPPRQWQDFLKTIKSTSQFSLAYEQGAWSPLSKLPGAWYRSNKNAEHPGAKAVSFATRKNFSAARRYRPDLGASYEVRGQARLPEGASTFRVNFGTPSEYSPTYVIVFYRLELATTDRKSSIARFGWSNDNSPGKNGPEIGEVVQFRVRRQGQRISWWINDTPIVENERIDRPLPFGPCAFGISIDTKGGIVPLSFENLEARKLGENG